MSAGTGIRHSEFNASKTEPLSLLQLWVIPKKRNIEPRYDQKTFKSEDRENKWQIVVSPDDKGALWINQDSIFALSHLTKGSSLTYTNKFSGSGVYLFIIEGSLNINSETINRRDAVEITNADSFDIKANEDSEILVIEVPMLQLQN